MLKNEADFGEKWWFCDKNDNVPNVLECSANGEHSKSLILKDKIF